MSAWRLTLLLPSTLPPPYAHRSIHRRIASARHHPTSDAKMEDAKLVQLHETLKKLQPRGKSGGLGFGGAFGAPTKKDDGLPKNGA